MTFKQLLATIDKKQWQVVIFFIVLMIIITTAPFIYAYLNAPQGYSYLGIHALAPGDYPVYFNYINQIKEGNFLLKDYYTSEPQSAGILNLLWLKVGLLARVFDLSPLLAFQLSRILMLILFIPGIYIFISYFFKNKTKRYLSLVFVCFSSGIGAYFVSVFDILFPNIVGDIDYKWPIDLWVTESNIFLTLYQSPHFILSWLLMALFFLFSLLAIKNNKYLYSLIAGFIGLYWFNFHPYYFPAVFAILFVYILVLAIKNKKIYYFYHYIISLVLSLPFVIYHYYKIKTDFLVGFRAAQNVTFSPDFMFIALGFGFLFAGGVLAIIYIFDHKKYLLKSQYLFLIIWAIVGLALVYSPIPWQRKFLMGLQMPLIFLTVFLIYRIRAYLKSNKEKFYTYIKNNYGLFFIIFLFLFAFSTVFNLTRDLIYYQQQNLTFYISNSFIEATDWLKENNKDQKAILSSERNGLRIPAYVNQPVFIGHGHETLHFKQKFAIHLQFFTNQYDDQTVIKFFQKYNIGYLFFTDIEKRNAQYQPEEKDYLEKVFTAGDIDIYQFKEI